MVSIVRPLRRLALTGPAIVAADRKSTRLNSSHANISYAAFCLNKPTHTLLRERRPTRIRRPRPAPKRYGPRRLLTSEPVVNRVATPTLPLLGLSSLFLAHYNRS